ncbi:MAG: outer membrane beta-barrel protein [Bacteroidota bacterium]|nr:outer membrane beta-barrel protein [Bacteroidota bacterium]
MPANEFEKQVQKKLGEFRLDPSASVWEKVEEEVRKKKRRRVIFYFLLPATLVLLGFSLYYFMMTGQKTGLAQQQVTQSQETTKKEIPVAGKENTLQPQQTNNDAGLMTHNEKKQKKESVYAGKDAMEVLVNTPSINHSKGENAKKNNHKNERLKIESGNPLVISSTIPERSSVTKPAGQEENKVKDEASITNPPGDTIRKDDVLADQENRIPVKKDNPGTETVVPKDNKQKETVSERNTGRPKIKWGIDFSAGFISSQTHVFSLASSYNAYTFATSPPANPGGTSSASAIPPSSIRPGASFRLGIMGEWQVSRRSYVSAGLRYAYASNRIRTGTEMDTSLRVQTNTNSYATQVDRVYRGSPENDYTNRYHFVSIPLGYHWQINQNKKLPLQWDIGVSFDYLLATNALVYSQSYGGIYYHDKKAFNKTHFNIGTGLSFRFKGKKETEWVLGPEISFDTRSLLDNAQDPKQYLLYGGIHTTVLFPKKKK